MFSILCGQVLFAQGITRTKTHEQEIYFEEAYRYIDSTYRNNRTALAEIRSVINSAQASGFLVSLEIQGSASPTGSEKYNRALSANRANEIEAWILRNCNVAEAIITKSAAGINWRKLRDLIAASDVPYRDAAIEIIDNVPVLVYDDRGSIVSSRKKQLMDLDLGGAWEDMLERFFPDVRSASAVLIHVVEDTRPEILEVQPPARSVASMTAPEGIRNIESAYYAKGTEQKDGFIMGLKTNLLYDAALVPNIGAEFHLGRNFTVGGSWMYAWWSSNPNHYYWRIYGGDINFRKYFGRIASEKPMQGHHLGVYAQAYTYDFELGGRGIMGGIPGGSIFDKLNYGVGVEYGYSLPVAKRFNIDFSIGAGYFGGEYREYKPIDGHYVWQATKYRHYFGPTKAEVSLIWTLGNGAKRGGGR